MQELSVHRRGWVRWRPLLLVAALSLVATGASYAAIHHYVQKDVARRFDRSVHQINALVRGQLRDYLQILFHARAFFASSDRVDAHEFATFVAATQFDRTHSALHAIEFIERVPAEDVPAFEGRAAADGAPLRVFRTPGAPPADEFAIIKYALPAETNRGAMGFDAASNPIAHPALDRAAETGLPAVTAPLRLVQEQGASEAVVLYLAVYREGMPTDTLVQRRAAVRGWLAAVLRVEDLAQIVERHAENVLDVGIVDVTDPAHPQPLCHPNSAPAAADGAGLARDESVFVGGRHWRLSTRSHGAFTNLADEAMSVAVLPVGLLVSGALLVITWSLTTTRARAIALAEAMTASLRVAEAEAQKLALVAARTTNAVLITDPCDRIEWANEAFTRITGWTLAEARGQRATDLLCGPDTDTDSLTDILGAIRDDRGFDARLVQYRKDRSTYWAHVEGQPLHDDAGRLVGYMSLQSDITAQKRAEDQLREAAQTDRLTGLFNREQFLARVERAIRRRATQDDFGFAMLFLDFDRFKLINDSLGHHTGDQLLIEVAHRLQSEVERLSLGHLSRLDAIVARAGGDEFTILLTGDVHADIARDFAQALITALARPYQLADHEVHFSASIGITTSAMPYVRADEVLRDADTAMYAAKAAGKGGFLVFDAKMHRDVLAKLRLESDLRKALSRGQLRLVYQPIVSLETGRLQGFEALMRWDHPELGPVEPSRFIPIAEESGLILPIGEWALHESCRQLAEWRTRLPEARDLRINVNLSRRQLLQGSLVDAVLWALEQSGLPAHALYLEITESMLMEMADASNQTVARLRELGVRLVMDDFGTGYSSLSYLHQFPISGLKIDRSFVSHMAARRDFVSIVQAIVALAHSMDIRVTAEGIETREQLVQLQALECDDAQGHFFTKPLAADEAGAFIVQHAAQARAA